MLFPLAFVSACSSFQNPSPAGAASVGYANLLVLVDAELAGDGEWQALVSGKKKVQSELDALKDATSSGMGNEGRRFSQEMDELLRREDRIKKRIYPQIYSAVKNVAKRRKIDFVLTMDDGLLFASSRFDLTGDILQELKTIRARSDPLIR